MQPGAYRLVFRTATSNGSKFTDVRNFSIRSGQTTSVAIFGKQTTDGNNDCLQEAFCTIRYCQE